MQTLPVGHTQSGIAALPAAARATIHRTLGADDAAFHAAAAAGSLHATNARHGLAARFGTDGVHIDAGADALRVALRAVGYGDALQPVASATPTASQNVVTYQRGDLSEWYVNGPLGLEQGFTLGSRPKRESSGELTLALALSGDFSASLTDGRRSLELTGATGSLRYAGLFAADADGADLPAAIELRGGEILLRVDDTGARYPLTIDPFVQQAKLTASDGAPGERFGYSVAIAGDTIVAGAFADDVGSNADQGSAYVFQKPAGGWATGTQTAKLTASDGAARDFFGISVAIAGDTIVVGASGDDIGSNADQGSAYVFRKPAGGWAAGIQTAKLTASDGAASDFFGGSVAIDGDTIVVGASEVGPNAGQGSAYVFQKPAGGWATAIETAKLTASDGASGDGFGWSVATSGDTIVVGAALDVVGSNYTQGSAYVFQKPAGGWATAIETAKLTALDGAADDSFGISVAIAGNTIVVGAETADGAFSAVQGAAYVFQRPAGGWATGTETAKLTASDGAAFDLFGWSVAIAGDTIVVGARSDDIGENERQGSAYVFQRPAGGWATGTETAKLIASDGTDGDRFGISVAISGDSIVVGADFGEVNPDAGAAHGSAYVFRSTAMSIGDASVAEGHAGTTDLTFTVTRSGDASGTSSVDYSVDDGTATAGSDYVDESGTVTFPANDTSETITVAVNGDLTDEPDETFTVKLSNPTNAIVIDASGTGTITDDDPGPTFSIADASAGEAAGTATFTVTKSGLSVLTATVDFATAAHTAGANPATAGTDYSATSGTLSFGPTDTEKTISVPITNDTADEPAETFLVNLSEPTNATISDDKATGSITDDDEPPAASTIRIADVRRSEAPPPAGPSAGTTAFRFTVTRSDTNGTASVRYRTGNGSATSPADYTPVPDGTVRFAAGQASATITITVKNDSLDEFEERFVVHLSGATNATIADAWGVGTIVDDDAAPSLRINDITVRETDGTSYATFRVSLSAASGKNISVGFATADGTARAGSDYTARSGRLYLSAGTTLRTLSVAIRGENLRETTEHFLVNLTAPSNATVADARGRANVQDDDPDDPLVLLTKTGPEEARPGTLITYHLTYKNLGPFASANARMVDTLPANVTFYSASGATYDKAKRTVTWRLGTVPTDATGTRYLRVRVGSTLADGTLILNRLDFYGDQTFAAPAFERTTAQR